MDRKCAALPKQAYYQKIVSHNPLFFNIGYLCVTYSLLSAFLFDNQVVRTCGRGGFCMTKYALLSGTRKLFAIYLQAKNAL